MKTPILIFSICAQAGAALAGPDASASYLTHTPVTMMDLGILRLDLALEKQAGGYATYDFNENRINIDAPFAVAFGTYSTLDQAEAACGAWVSKVKTQFGVDLETGAPTGSEFSFAADLFRHEGYENETAPKMLYQDLDRMFVLRCGAWTTQGTVRISSPLLGKGYAVSKE